MPKSENKTKPTQKAADEFLESVSDPVRREESVRIKTMLQEVTGEKPVMWGDSIVGFGQYHYKYDSGREGDFMKIGFAPRKQALTVYIMPGFDRYDDLMQKLGKYKTGRSCLYIKKLTDIDWPVLEELCNLSYRYMTEKYG
jgi:hypothetical protein